MKLKIETTEIPDREQLRSLLLDAADQIAGAGEIDFPAAETCVLIDPPRKGCSRAFLEQLAEFGQLVIVRREQRAAFQPQRDVFADRPGKREPIAGAGSASDFVH